MNPDSIGLVRLSDRHKNDYLHFESFYTDDLFIVERGCYCTACYFARNYYENRAKGVRTVSEMNKEEFHQFMKRFRQLGLDR